MRIMFPIYKLSSGGAERTVSYLASYLAEKGHEVYILTYIDDDFYTVSPKVHRVTLNQIKLPSTSFNKNNLVILIKRIVNLGKKVFIIPNITKQIRPDVVLAMLSSMATGYIRMHKKGVFKLISSERANPIFEEQSIYRQRVNIFNECDGVIFQTERAKLCYSEDIQRKAVVIPNAVGNSDVYKDIQIPKQRRKAICSVGRLTKQKDYKTLICAFSMVSRKYSEYILEIYGCGEMLNELINYANELGIKDKVFFMGEDKHAILKCSDATCFVLSSVFEGMPNALMEAMAVGLPCISTNCPFGPAELIEDRVNGLLVPVGDCNALKDAMISIIQDRLWADNLGRRAQKIIDRNSMQKQCAMYEKYILHILNSR